MGKQEISTININDTEIEKLLTRKPKNLGGRIAEYLFISEFIHPSGISYTSDWWYMTAHNKYSKKSNRYFFLASEKTSPIDKKIINKIINHNNNNDQIYDYRIYQDSDGVKIAYPNGSKIFTAEEFVKKYMNSKPSPLKVNDLSTEPELRKQYEEFIQFFIDRDAIDYYNNLLKSIQLDDLFFNLYSKDVSDIDLIVENTIGDPICIDIKFKYPDRSGNYGIDKNQYEGLVKTLDEIGIPFYNVILDNDCVRDNLMNRKETRIFDYLKLKEGKDLPWLYSYIPANLQSDINVAPSDTSWEGAENADSPGQKVHSFSSDMYAPLTDIKQILSDKG